jgi:hypothetical protein
LARWRRAHPDGTLYAAYYGYADARYYGLDVVPLVGTTVAERRIPPTEVRGPGYIAISAMALQGICLPSDQPDLYAAYRDRQPDWILGHSIYIYKLPAGDQPATQKAAARP